MKKNYRDLKTYCYKPPTRKQRQAKCGPLITEWDRLRYLTEVPEVVAAIEKHISDLQNEIVGI